MTNPLSRVPKWAWLVAGGVGIGGVALKFISNKRDADAAMEAGTTGTDPSTGQPVGTAPPGVIVPPVLVGGGGDSGEGAAALSELAGVLGQGFADVLGTASGLAWTPAEITGLIGQSTGAVTDQLTAILGAAGNAPQPAAQVPVVVNVTPSSPAPAAPSVPTPAGHNCPGAFPLWSTSRGACYKECSHTETCPKGSQGCVNGKRRNNGNCYSDGSRVNTGFTTP